MATLAFDRVGKQYPAGTQAVTDPSIKVADGEFLVFVGPSGCGKSTALRMVAGLADRIEVGLKTEELRFFDMATVDALRGVSTEG